ncbi:hypothetical protein EJ08DRAFT_691734 [Tothia fuscella]|uniref:Yippee domain-containing protein n=1 Tax=Tothia fuscella TaxID=1048955 RepID=A0A9P4P4V2_9PEZI|nr:hypothetical protein EJ08DRAFT_691734 [Tothia fuscella]
MENVRPRVASDHPAVIDSQRSTSAIQSSTTMEIDDDESSTNRSTIAHCRACDKPFGEFFNGWSKVTGSYYLPSLPGSYTVSLHPKGKPKPASAESALVGCTIQPLVCNNCDDTLGIVCKSAPDSKRAYAGREFFKLPRLQLRSDLTGNPVHAIIEESHSPQGDPEEPKQPARAMETPGDHRIVTASKPSHTAISSSTPPVPKDHDELRRHSHAASRQPSSHVPPQKATAQNYESAPAPVPNRHHDRAVPLASPINGHTHANGLSGSGAYPSHIMVKLDAIDRLQTQVNLNRATLESCTRDMSRLENMVTRLQQSFQESFDIMRAEFITSRQHVAQAAASVPQGDRLDDQALEVFTATLSNVAGKANEVDSLKVQMELIKRKLRRLEENGASGAAQGREAPYSGQPRERSMHRTPINQAMTPTILHQTPPSRPDGRSHQIQDFRHDHGHSYHSVGAAQSQYRPEGGNHSHSLETEVASSGWVSVNPSAKRGLPNGVDGRSDTKGTPIGSPKRLKLAPLESRHVHEAASRTEQIRYEQRMETEEPSPYVPSQSQTQSQSQLQPQSQSQSHYRRVSYDSYPDSTNQSSFVPYTADQPPDDSWRPESQRAVSNPAHPTPRGRGRGRGGRPRKSLPVEVHTIRSTPEWERDGWSASHHVGPDGFYHAGRGGLVRRGSSGASGQPPMPLSPGSTIGDPYGHTKKTRTKPIRNPDGVLIRKDGRPDMRSQSSAANLRKVHARKEEERRMDGGSGSGLATAITSVDGHSPGDSHEGSQDMDFTSTQEKRKHIMRQMFPNGVDEQRGRLYSAEQYFPHHNHSPPAIQASTSRSDMSISDRGSLGSFEAEGDDGAQTPAMTIGERPVDIEVTEGVIEDSQASARKSVSRPEVGETMTDRSSVVEKLPGKESHAIRELVREVPSSTQSSMVTTNASLATTMSPPT